MMRTKRALVAVGLVAAIAGCGGSTQLTPEQRFVSDVRSTHLAQSGTKHPSDADIAAFGHTICQQVAKYGPITNVLGSNFLSALDLATDTQATPQQIDDMKTIVRSAVTNICPENERFLH